MKKILLFYVIMFIPFIAYAEEFNLEWQKSWGGNNADHFTSVILSDDGGFVAVGETKSTDIEGFTNNGSRDAYIIKYDKDGNVLWQKDWGGKYNDYFESVVLTNDGDFIVVGHSNSLNIEGLPNKGSSDAIIVKYDKDGNLLWQKSWGGNNDDCFFSSVLTNDNGIIVVGKTKSLDIDGLPNKGNYDAIIVKYDIDGNMLWQKNYGGSGEEVFESLVLNNDNGFVVAGESNSIDIEGLSNKGNMDAIIVKYDKDGNMLWQNCWGGNNEDKFVSIALTNDDGFTVIGNSNSINVEDLSNKGDIDAIIVKYDKDGNMLWQKNYGGRYIDNFYSIILTDDGGFIVVGSSSSNDIEGILNKGSYDGIIIKYDNEGNILSQKNWESSDAEHFKSSIEIESGIYIVVGRRWVSDVDAEASIIKYSIKYDLKNSITDNGTSMIEQQGKYGIIRPTPNEKYEVDNIIVKDKDGNILDLEITKLEDGTYSFPLYTDVSVEVIFKEKIENPKTGILDMITILFIGAVVSICGFILVKRYNERYEI